MPGRIHFNEVNNIIEIHSWGELTNSDLFHSQGEVERLHQENGTMKMLFDTKAVDLLPSPYALYEFVNSLLVAGKPGVLRLALHTSFNLRDDIRFVETVAVNRGILARSFLDYSEALAWLNDVSIYIGSVFNSSVSGAKSYAMSAFDQ